MIAYMFHYVTCDLNYPHFDLNSFDKKIQELKKYYEIASLSDLSNKEAKNLDKKFLILTFDDGTKDHYLEVFPVLKKYNISGLFFLNSNIESKEIFSIHYIHKLLSTVNIKDLYNKIMELDKNLFNEFSINNCSVYDDDITYKVKRFLQEDNHQNKEILLKLLNQYNISNNYNDYYISMENIREMKEHGMEFGLHTFSHKRLSQLSYKEQYDEIKENYDFFVENNIFTKERALSFPFGDYNNDTLNISRGLGINYLFGIDGINCNSFDERVIYRLDCNDLKE